MIVYSITWYALLASHHVVSFGTEAGVKRICTSGLKLLSLEWAGRPTSNGALSDDAVVPTRASSTCLHRLRPGRRSLRCGAKGRGGADPYIQDWIMIAKSNTNVPPEPSRYLSD